MGTRLRRSRIAQALTAVSVGAGVLVATTGVAAAVFPTTTTVSSSANPAPAGAGVTLTATVQIGLNAPPITGQQIHWTVGTAQQSSTITCNGIGPDRTCTATLAVPAAPAGTSVGITARYDGDEVNDPSEGSFTQSWGKLATSTAISSAANPAVAGDAVTLTATVAVTPSNGQSAQPTGSVTWTVPGSPDVTTSLTCAATCTTQTDVTAPDGSMVVVATYNGDGATHPSTSPEFSQQGVAPQTCASTTGSCSVTANAANGSARLTVTTIAEECDAHGKHKDKKGNGHKCDGGPTPVVVKASFSSERLSCASNDTVADTGVGDVIGDVGKTFTYTVFGDSALAADPDGDGVSQIGRCWASDTPFPGSSPEGAFHVGLLSDCQPNVVSPPCVISQGYDDDAWVTVVSAPAGDPRQG